MGPFNGLCIMLFIFETDHRAVGAVRLVVQAVYTLPSLISLPSRPGYCRVNLRRSLPDLIMSGHRTSQELISSPQMGPSRHIPYHIRKPIEAITTALGVDGLWGLHINLEITVAHVSDTLFSPCHMLH